MDGDSSDDNTCCCNCLMKDCVFLAHLYHRVEWDRCAFFALSSIFELNEIITKKQTHTKNQNHIFYLRSYFLS